MATETTLNDVPTFKLAKVGKDRDRKRGGAAWFNGGRGVGGLGGLGAGSEGAGGMFANLFGGMSLAKGALALLITGLLSAGAWQFGRMFSPTSAPKGGKLFADKSSQKYSDTSDVVKGDNSIPNSLGYVSGSLDGMTPEERAKKAAEEEAARKAAEDAAKKKAEEDAAAAAAADKDKAPADATAGAAVGGSGAGMPSNPFSSHFGGLSNGLSGGAGLSGGIGQGFGGMGGGGLGSKGVNGNLSAMKAPAAAATSRAAARPMTAASGKNLAFGQLKQASSASRSAAATSGDASAATASQPFDGGSNAGGTSIDGPGVGSGATSGSGVGGGANSPGDGPTGGGGGSTSCADGQETTANGCETVNTPSGSNAEQSVTTMVEMAEAMMVLLAILAAIVLITEGKGPLAFIAQAMKAIMVVMGIIIAGLGAAILMQGDTITGGIVTAVGAAVTIWAFAAPEKMLSMQGTTVLAAGALIASALGGLAASATSASKISTQ